MLTHLVGSGCVISSLVVVSAATIRSVRPWKLRQKPRPKLKWACQRTQVLITLWCVPYCCVQTVPTHYAGW